MRVPPHCLPVVTVCDGVSTASSSFHPSAFCITALINLASLSFLCQFERNAREQQTQSSSRSIAKGLSTSSHLRARTPSMHIAQPPPKWSCRESSKSNTTGQKRRYELPSPLQVKDLHDHCCYQSRLLMSMDGTVVLSARQRLPLRTARPGHLCIAVQARPCSSSHTASLLDLHSIHLPYTINSVLLPAEHT